MSRESLPYHFHQVNKIKGMHRDKAIWSSNPALQAYMPLSTSIKKALLETQRGALYQPRGVGWGGRWEGGSKGRGYMYTYGWFLLRFDRKQNSEKQLFFNKKIKKTLQTTKQIKILMRVFMLKLIEGFMLKLIKVKVLMNDDCKNNLKCIVLTA